MRKALPVLLVLLVTSACSGSDAAGDLPTEAEFYEEVISCAEDQADREFGPVRAGSEGGLTAESRRAIDVARAEAEDVFWECFDQALPPVPDLAPLSGYGDLSAGVWEDVDWEAFAVVQAECVTDQGLSVAVNGNVVEPRGDIHLRQLTVAYIEACGEGIPLPPFGP